MSEPTADAPAGENAEQMTCKFPGCGDEREPKKDLSAPGPAPEYCVRPDHNAGSAWRAKRKQKARAAGGAAAMEESETDKPVTDSAADAVNVREDVVRQIEQLGTSLERYVTLLQTVTDPEAAEAQALAVESQANTRIATADARADQERNNRIAAVKAKEAAQAEKEAADQAAEQMEAELEAARTQFTADVERITAEANAKVEAANASVEEARAEANAKVEAANASVEEARADAERLVAEAKALAEAHVTAARQGAADEIAAIRKSTELEIKQVQDDAGKVQVEADRKVVAMTTTLEEGQAAAAAQVEEANGKAAAAEARATEAEESGRQAMRNAEGMVTAAKEAAEVVRAGLAAELERTGKRLETQETRVDALRGELDQAKEQLRVAADRERALEARVREAEAPRDPKK